MWKFFIEQRKFTYIVALAVALLGFVSILQIPKESSPEITIPVVTVVTPFPGASPVDVEQFVTDVVETPLLNLEDIKEVTSSSSTGASTVVIEFQIGVDIQEKLADVREAVDRVTFDLPTDAEDPLIQRVSFNDTPIKIFALSGPYPTTYLRQLGEQLQEDLEGITGVKRVDIVGGEEREIRVEVDPYALDQFGLTLSQLTSAISRANSDIPVGSIESADSIHSVRFAGRLSDAQSVSSLPIATRGRAQVHVSDVATVVDGYEARTASTRLSVAQSTSETAISLSIIKSEGGLDALDVVGAADKAILEAQDTYLPSNIRIEVVDDFAEFIRTDLINLSTSGLQTTLIVILLILAFLGWREAILAGLAIPMTFLITFVFLTYMGESLNFLTLFSLILALGILVDGAIVITEGIHQQVARGKSPQQAAIDTVLEFKAPLISGTLTTVFAFLPMMLTSGLIGEFIKTIPVTVSIVLFGSLFVALALIPTFSVPLLTKRAPRKGRLADAARAIGKRLSKPARVLTFIRETGFESIRGAYLRQLQRFLDRKSLRRLFVIMMIVGFVGSIMLPGIGALKINMFPSADEDRLYVDVSLPIGTPIAQTTEAMLLLEETVAQDTHLESYLISVGSGSPISGGTSERSGSMILNLVDRSMRPSSIDLLEELDETMSAQLPRARVSVSQLSDGPDSGSPVEVLVTGPDLTELEKITEGLAREIEDIPGARDVKTSIDQTNGEFVFRIDRAAAARYNVSTLEIAGALRTALFGSTATTIKTPDQDIDVIVQARLNREAGVVNAPRVDVSTLAGLTIQTAQGPLPLSSFVTNGLEASRATIRHTDGDRIASVTSGVSDGTTATEVFANIQTYLDQNRLPDGYTAGFRGEDEDLQQTLSDLGKAMIIGIFLIAALLVLQFQSYRQPLYVLLSIPLSLIGVLPGLALIGQPLSFPGMIGIVALAGIVVNNGIILIDRINENRKRGLVAREALIEACSSRLRPVILTTITTIAGMLPLVLSEPSWGPLGFAIIFGLLFSTVLTLFSIPLLYNRWADK